MHEEFWLERPHVVSGRNGLSYLSIRGVLEALREIDPETMRDPDALGRRLLEYAQWTR